ncbi:MAG: DUF302 domain-containing protein [Candidatus Accumulibacter sp.]|uniref:DUF302 domain-containing protein n=1 Tax=Accumulibacter sp. TaxID=2053492 RepID=UPI001E0151BE|nr:DUF302 domain-containing protein [Accumulibacter sp.]MCB1943341.1 DUF302 domain-containing protein [Accumulibacter sp.]MCP5246988.1 DUF302 domain-containing protein [Accumulibacter sp.]
MIAIRSANAASRRPHAAIVLAALLAAAGLAHAGNPVPYPGTLSIRSPHAFAETVTRLESATEKNNMGLVAKASASAGAAARGEKIAGNAVLMVFRNDYAVRMLAASVAAGIEAPIRLYVTEASDGEVTITYRTPSSIFAPYESAELDVLARELDPLFDAIIRDAVRK